MALDSTFSQARRVNTSNLWLLVISLSVSLLALITLRLLLHRTRIRSLRKDLQSLDQGVARERESDYSEAGWRDWLATNALESPYGEWLEKTANRAGIWEVSKIKSWLVRKLDLLIGSLIIVVILRRLNVLPIELLLLMPIATLTLPDLLLFDRARARLKRIADSLPETIDLIAMSVSAGIGFHAGLQRVAATSENPLSEEFSRVLSEMQLGQGRSQALLAMSERLEIPTLRSFVNSVLQVDRLGVPLARVLEDQSQQMRLIRREQAREHAQKLPVKILAPIMIFLLPSILIIVLGPALVTIMRSFT